MAQNISMESEHLRLIPCDKQTLEFALQGNARLAKHLDVAVPDNWTELGNRALKYALEKIASSKNEAGWWTYFPIHKTDNKLIGSCGYKGRPDSNGLIEIGYEITKQYRNKGLATELTKILVRNAFSFEEVSLVRAHTLSEENASTKVLTKCGFSRIEEVDDNRNGKLCRWFLKK
jgi:RimJ/RimL family protein N-acetyltransferase